MKLSKLILLIIYISIDLKNGTGALHGETLLVKNLAWIHDY